MAVAKAEWGTWFMMGALLGVAGVAGLVFCVRGFLRSGYRGILIAAVALKYPGAADCQGGRVYLAALQRCSCGRVQADFPE